MAIHKLDPNPSEDSAAQAKIDLAAALRLAVYHQLDEGIDNHFTVTVPGYDDRFLVLPFGFHWSEARAIAFKRITAFVEYERGRRFDFATLNNRCNRIANALLARGVQPGDRVALLLKNGIEFVETYFAAAKIGAVTVPINWRLVAAEISYILEDSGSKALVYDDDFDEAVTALQAGHYHKQT